jgi:hypothetical protein
VNNAIELDAPTTTTRDANRAEAAVNDALHAKKIGDAMMPDPREWTFEGEVADAGNLGARCTCGHPIRYVFTIRRDRDGATLPIGSVCIESTVPVLMAIGAQGLASRLEAALAAHRKALEDAKKAVRDAKANVEVQALMAELAKIKEWAVATKARGGYLPRAVWELATGRTKIKAATTPGRTAAGLRTKLTTLYLDMIESAAKYDRLPALMPQDSKVITKVAQAI